MLLSMLEKVLKKVLLERMKEAVNVKGPRSAGGFPQE
jgi:hypothetical protein